MNSPLQFLLIAFVASFVSAAEPSAPAHASIPLTQLGAEAQKQISGKDSISISQTKDGAKLRAAMQDIEGEATPTGLWLTSTADEDQGKPNHFRVMATALSRTPTSAALSLTTRGCVRSTPDSAVWIRPGLVEQYTVSTDGVRQDFVIPERPPGSDGHLTLDLALTGASAESTNYGAKLTVAATGRELAYSRLKVTDATGREIPAEMQAPAPDRLRVVVQDAAAVYPLCIDPTFGDADWVSIGGFAGANEVVRTMAVDGSGNLYIGGHFTAVGTLNASYVAKWNGSRWSALGAGMDNDVNALVVNGSDLYAAGIFSTAGGISASRIAKWNGTTWSALGAGTNSDVAALTMNGGNLYAGGNFTMAGGVAANCIAQWNGSAWSALGSGLGGVTYPWVNALTASGSDIYAAGIFNTAGAVSASTIAKWNGSEWSDVGAGIFHPSGIARTLAAGGGKVYAGGDFGLSQWDGTSWQAVGSLNSSSVYSLTVSGSQLYAAALFDVGAQYPVTRISLWNGTAWSDLATGTGGNSYVFAMAVSGGSLFIGGGFNSVDGTTASCIARWNGIAWSALNTGLSGTYVFALAVMNGDLYAGGNFTVGTSSGNACYIAKWNGSQWSALGTGMDAPVYSLAVSGSDLYVGGQFTAAGGMTANRIAKWDGSAWSALGSGVSSQTPAYTFVYALAVSGSDLYAGGNFTSAGGSSISYIARWNGSTWSAVGPGTSPAYAPAWALTADGGDVYAAGEFGAVGKWNGTTWSTLGVGLGGVVKALAVSGGKVYAGGEFFGTRDGSVSFNGLAQWDGSTWSAVGAYSGGYVYALAASGTLLYAGGSANSLAKWNGSSWFPLGSGVSNLLHDSGVYALAASGDFLFVGGSFDTAGGIPVPHLARTDISPYSAPTPALGAVSGVQVVTATLNGTVNPNGLASTAQFEYGLTTSYGTSATATISSADGTAAQNVSATITGLTSNTTYHYRLTATNSAGSNSTSDGTFITLPGQKDYRMLFFGTTSNTGDAADTADPDGDGMPNLLEWAFGLPPTIRNQQPTLMQVSGETIQFSYMRYELAVQEGVGFTVEWSDTLAAGSWSSTEVIETVLPGPPFLQVVQTQVPQGTNGRRFVRLSVTPPP